jgi:hypothetical protein
MGIDFNQMDGGYDKFVVDANATIPNPMSEPTPTDDEVSIGQEKYARREGAESIYKDETRNTADDNAASTKAEGSVIGCDTYSDEGEESQGI